MRIIPISDDIDTTGADRATLGPPPGVPDSDCETIEIVRYMAQVPSGEQHLITAALVQVSAKELDQIKADGGRFWIRFFGATFPPVLLDTLRDPEPDV